MTINDWEPSFTQRFDDAPTYKDGDRSGGMWWPAGTRHVPNGALRYRLASSAQWHARTALHQFADDSNVDHQLQAAISAGTSVELMLKAYLVGVAPALLADKASKDSVLMVSGRGALTTSRARDFRSVLAADALATVRLIVKSFPRTPQNLEAFAVRNAACHMALVDANQLRLAAVEMVKIIDALLGLVQLNRARFWGQGALSVADTLAAEASTDLQHRFEAKLAAAKREVFRLTLSLKPEAKASLLAALSARVPVSLGDVAFPEPCPACQQRGTLFYTIEEPAVDTDDASDSLDGPTTYPISFVCTACNLSLNDEELALAGMPVEENLI